ncbi:hypothetical protein MF271_21645 (plasmid) [Deinococcus sp. KNUC1210]|uniref:hypothetical protein n=1 Tax=Deinococcus sp. KNUC1210 TaxID=2917691 RepID=UPI001EF08B7B|nr:hypothetical protein [Deinococcus sp. KNUC1210]ULH17875.1 hypothetical protein MF271_21645 [Deinococcus sp. KNUC1210]
MNRSPSASASRSPAGRNGKLATIDATTVTELTVALVGFAVPADLATIMARVLINGEPIVALAGLEAKCLGTVMLHPLPPTAVFSPVPVSTGGRRSRKARTAQPKAKVGVQPQEEHCSARKPEKKKAAVTPTPDDTGRTDTQDTPLFGGLDNSDQS